MIIQICTFVNGFLGECNQAIIEIFINLKTMNDNDEKVTAL